MLNKIKKQIFTMLDTLGNALAQYLSAPSDEFLDEIGRFIDAINTPLADEDKDAITLSEQLKASLKNPVLSKVERLYNEYCTIIENRPVQYKAVFLPYYDNTWDSLASVYEAFASDPMVVTEIVIIPIRRNTPAGWKMVYEDYLTPKGIPNTHYSQYSFENDLPDFVFYNNPYDGVNIEKFQSHNIKLYAGCMVYIPYFLYRYQFTDKELLKKEIESTTQLPGHDSADIFITQGKSFMKKFSHRSRNGGKMIMLGNPKTDNIYKNMQDYPMYPHWDEVVKDKTVFMLNTHYSLAVKGAATDAVTHLLDIVEKNEDIALIWRPHPQSFLMLDNNSPASVKFKSYIERATNCNRIIMDRTPSNISAIMYSDAVISSPSSVVAESIIADKPVFYFTLRQSELLPPYDVNSKVMLIDSNKLNQIRKYDTGNLSLLSAICYIGFDDSFPDKYDSLDYIIKASLQKFINEISNGIDIKKELRGMYREQLLMNRDGDCGQKIHDYIVNKLKMQEGKKV